MGLLDEIKKDAKRTGSKIQSNEASKLMEMFDKMFYLDKNIDEETKFVHQVMTRGLNSSERVGLHASALIVSDNQFCVRQQVLSLLFKQLQGEQLPVSLLRIFEEGNAIHEKWQRLLIRAGYAKANTLDRTRFDNEYQISYTPDIVCRIPEFYDGVMIGEIKSVNTYQFSKMSSHPSAKKQLQWYMHLCIREAKRKGTWNEKDYLKGFVLCDDKNTQDYKLFLYDYDKDVVEPFVNRCEDIQFLKERFLTENKMPKRICPSPDCKMASKCPMKDACFNIGIGRVKI